MFDRIARVYDRMNSVMTAGMHHRWRRRAVDLAGVGPSSRALDVATGTGLVADALLGRGFRVTGLDQSTEMLDRARERFGGRVVLVEGSAEELPFADASFDHLTVTYLLRYVDDPAATLVELARVVRPGGTIAMLEFGVPRGIWRPAWNVWVGVGLPVAGRLISPGWHEVGRFLGPSIRSFHETYPEPVLLALWRAAGVEDVRRRHLSLGGGVVLWGVRGDAK